MISPAHIAHLAASAPLASGYRFELLRREEIPALVKCVNEWFPGISVGGASRYMREDFYRNEVLFADAPTHGKIVLSLKQDDELVGMFASEIDDDTESVYAALGVAAPAHRGSNLAHAGITFTEALGIEAAMGFAFGMATLKSPFAQRSFERAGWNLIGIAPGYDRELIEPGVVKRVYEAVYAKVLAADANILQPDRRNLTPRTQSFFDLVFANEMYEPRVARH
jgi:hypothetical protein